MPPATLAPSVSLLELADVAIGTPEVGAVNFTALHTLIVAMLKNLNLQEERINYQSQLPEQSRSFEAPRASSSTQQLPGSKERRRSSVSRAPPPQALESQVKDLSGQVHDLSRQLKTMGSQVQAVVAHVQHVTAQTGGLQAREWLEAKEMDLLAQQKAQTESKVWKDLSELFFQKFLQRVDELERLMRERNEYLDLVSRRLSMMPAGEEATMVTWEELEQAITDGWRASQASTALPKRKGQASVTSNDIIIPSGASTKHPNIDQAMESATGFITDKTSSGTGGIGYPSEGVTGREQSRSTPVPGFPGREQHSRARDEAGPAKVYHPTVSQFRIESDRHRPSREQHGSAHLHRDERDHLRPVYQDLAPATWARDQHGGAYISQGPIYARPDQYGLGLLATDQLVSLIPSTYAQDMVPLNVSQLGATPPGMGEQELVPPGVVQSSVVPLLASGRDQQGLELPSSDQPGTVPLSTSQPGVILPGTDQRGVRLPGMDESGMGPPGGSQHGLVPLGIGQHGFAVFPMDQQGLLSSGLMQVATGQQGFVQPSFGTFGFMQPGTEQPGLVQPSATQPDLVQPGAAQPGLVQPGAARPGLVQPSAAQPGLVQPGTAQPGPVQPSATQPGLVEPGAARPGLVQPSAAQPGVVQLGIYQRGLVQPGEAQPGVVQPGAGQPGVVQPGAGQPGVMQPGAAQPGVMQPGAAQPGVMQPGAAQPSLVQPSATQPGLVEPGTAWPSLVQPGAAQPGLVQPGIYQRGLVQPGAAQRGLVQRGAGQPGLVQPDVTATHGFFHPGVSMPGLPPPGLVHPGAHPRGLVQPGASASPRSFMQPRTDQRGLVPPVIDHRGSRQSDTDRGSIPPGTEFRGFPTIHAAPQGFMSPFPYQHGVVYPGRDQYGWGSPFLASRGLALRGTDQEGLVPRETYRQGLMPPGGAQQGPTPLRTRVGSASQDQQPLETPEPDEGGHVAPAAAQPERARSVASSQDLMHPGPRGPGYPGVDRFVQVGLDPHETYDSSQPRVSVQTTPSQEAPFLRTTHSLDYFHRASFERSDIQRERLDSLDKLAPSFPMAVETFRLMGELVGLYVELKENMKDLDEEKAGQTDLEKLQFLLALMVRKSVPTDLQEQLKTLKALTKEICQEKARVRKGPPALRVARLDPLLCHRVTVADIEKELVELRESQERGKISLEHSVSEASLYLQGQLDKLRTIIENMLASSSKLLSMSMGVAPQKTLTALTPGQLDPEATCPACSLDLSHQVGMLVQRYEQLQDMVSNLAASRPSKKAKLQSQDEELLGHIQSAILQVQGDCEKLNTTTSNLIEDRRQKQKDIDLLYQGLEKLEKEKANREHLEMEIDVKADKSALAGKVSRVQFDATTEQLNRMMQELVAKMSGQEQDWQKMLDKLLVEMDNKVREPSPAPWALHLSVQYPLGTAPALQVCPILHRQLLAHFHCLSCDRPLETPVTGQVVPVTPVGPGLPGHRSIRPYTVFELEQVRKQSRSLQLGGAAFPRGDLAKTERSVGRLRSMHSKMLMDIEKVQIHFGGSVRASSQMIRELLQAQCLSSPCYKRWVTAADYTYSTVPRRCGGSHTLTYPFRRSRVQHLAQGLYPTEEIQIAMKHNEVDILGLDGHIYKGRMDTRLPGILSKDYLGILKHKAKQSRPHAHQQLSFSDSGQPLSRPQSAQVLAGSNSGSSPLAGGPFGVVLTVALPLLLARLAPFPP
uniref:Glutamine rich 2 n=1 Tax=Catagonus wagneri TaxID=51154 RepID=A0A8C4FFI6_9CETA